MRVPRAVSLVVLFCLLLACSGVGWALDQKYAQATPESYRVYSASLPFGYHTAGLAVAIRSRTIAVPDLAYASDSVQHEFASMQADPALGAAIRDMLTQSPLDLAPRFHITDIVELLNSDELDGKLHLNDTPLGRKAGWREFNQTHHDVDGLTEVSAIGYNPAHTVAIFYAIHRSGTGCADEGFEVLKKTKGQWRRSPDQGFSFAACN